LSVLRSSYRHAGIWLFAVLTPSSSEVSELKELYGSEISSTGCFLELTERTLEKLGKSDDERLVSRRSWWSDEAEVAVAINPSMNAEEEGNALPEETVDGAVDAVELPEWRVVSLELVERYSSMSKKCQLRDERKIRSVC